MNEPKPLPSETKNLVERVLAIASMKEVKVGDGWEPIEKMREAAKGGDALAGVIVKRLQEELSDAAPILATALASLADELRQAQERIEILTGTLERARSHIENRGAFRSHTLMLEMIDTALNDAAASGPKEG